MSLLKTKWLIELFGMLAISALIWFVGPLIAIAGSVPLDSELTRIICIGLLFLFWLSYRLYQHYLVQQRERQLVSGLTGSAETEGVTAQSASLAEINTLQRGFEEAILLLKSTAGQKHRTGQYLYELPWYAIIGAPGSGKTTALINSGLHFPLADKNGQYSVKGVSGTRDCDWWFSDEAVLLDTAGRYVTQDSYKEVDASAWHGFLQLLKKYRPRRPLNGVFVAVSLSDLLQFNEAQILQHASVLRQRIMELNGQLAIQLPVYVLLTKTDLVAGFNDFFSNLTEEERAQVWGVSFTSWQNNLQQNLSQFDEDFDEIIQRLTQRRLKRIQEERDPHRRTIIFDFPTQMVLLKDNLSKLLSATFSENRYEDPLLIRGVYFSSGTQEGTPIDRVMSALAASYKLDKQTVSIPAGRGKSYFLTKLLKQVIFPEAELVGVDQKVERRLKWINRGSYIAAIATVLLIVCCWFISFATNKSAIAEVEKQVEIYRSIKSSPNLDSRSAFLTLLPRMNALQTAQQVYKQAPWYAGFGLYQGDQIDAGITLAYQQLLRESFVNLLTQRLKERMQSAEATNLDVLYQLLRVYLMFDYPEHMDSKIAQAWIKLDWQQMFATDPQTQSQLQLHLDNLLSLALDKIPLDNNFVSAVRLKLSQTPQAMQIYGQFKNDNLLEHTHDINMQSQLIPNGARVYAYNGTELDSLNIPGLFTAYGYTDIYLKTAKEYVKQASEQNWVLGNTNLDNPAQVERLSDDILRLYLADYQKQWDTVLTVVKLKPQQSNNQLIDTLDVLSRPDSPLKLLLQTVEKNTTLSRLAADSAQNNLSKAVAGVAAALPDAATQKLLNMAKAQSANGTDPVKALEAYFEPYNQQVRSVADRPAPLDATLASIKNLHDYLLQVSSTPDKKAALAPAGGITPIQAAKMDFARLPAPMAAALSNLTSAGGVNIKTDAKQQLNEILKTAVNLPCNAALAGRYPFTKSAAQDVLMTDFIKIFAPNGVIDQYFNANLKLLVDTSALQWREMNSENNLGLAAQTLKQFQIAAKIKEAFFPTAGSSPQVQFELKPIALDDKVGTFRLNLEGQELVYQHGPEQISKFQWPGTNPSAGVRLVFESLDGKQVSRFKEGSWALFRLFDEFNIERTNLPDRFNLTIQVESYMARFELRAASVTNPFGLAEYQSFHCPESL